MALYTTELYSRCLGMITVPASVTGTLTETTLGSITIPAGVTGNNGSYFVMSHWSFTNSANTKTFKIQTSGGANWVNDTATANAVYLRPVAALQNNTTNSQQFYGSAGGNGFSSVTSGVSTSAIDVAVQDTLSFKATLTNTGETITLVGAVLYAWFYI